MPLAAGSQLGIYSVLDLLGSGGMGKVYRARDTRLGREVAIKGLPEEFSREPARLARFEREARMLAALNHPGVAAIYGLEEADGTQFIVMELVPGETLSERISFGALPLVDALRIGRQIAEALEAAHERGIIHRDLKPANIKVTPEGRVKVLDLGLAKAFDTKETSSDSDASLSPTLAVEGTQPGVILGTAEYMSPEQARGRAVDKRTDIWAFGCVMYELLSGRRAFTGETVTDVLAGILTSEPDWEALPPDTPPRIRDLLGRCLQKDPSRRLRDVGDARIEFEEALTELGKPPSRPLAGPASAPRSSRRRRALLFALPALVGLALAWALVQSRREQSLPPRPIQGNSLAVLPFRNLSAEPGGQVIGEGLVEIVSARLASLPGLQVVTPTAVVAAADKDPEFSRIAKTLGANLLLHGTIQRQGDRIRITYSILNTLTRQSAAAGTLDGSASDLFLLQDRLAENVSQALKLPRRAPRTPRPAGLEGAGAQERYVQAIGHLQRYDRPSSIDEAARLLEILARENPSSAIVQAALGRAYLARFNLTRDSKWLGPAAAAGERARQLDPGSPEVSSTLGELYLRTGKAADAVAAYRGALAAQPNNFDASLGLARAYDAAGDADRSEETYERAIQLQPAYFGGYSKLAGFYFNRGRWDEAAKAFQKVTELTPDNARAFSNLGACHFALGQFGPALEAFEKSVALDPTNLAYSNIGTAQYYLGRYPASAAAFEKALSLSPTHYVIWGNLGDALRLIPGRQAKAVEAYEKGITLTRAELATNPDDSLAHSYLALCLAKTGKKGEAQVHVRKSLASGANNPEVLFGAAVVANRSGRPAESVGYLERAVQAGFNPAIIRNEPELANLRKRDDFEAVLRHHPEVSSR
jgi:serine/threonine protein kinase/tetratricopeptide (TPR) repeat protein